MATLPVTVLDVEYLGTGLYGVKVALADGTTTNMIIPDSIATIEGVRISAVALAMLLDPNRPPTPGHHRGHKRYTPRTST